MTEERPTQQYAPPTAPAPATDWRHDTTVLNQGGYHQTQDAYGQTYTQALPTAGQWEQPPALGNPEADYWQSRFRRQRTWTVVLGGALAAALMLLAGGAVLIATGVLSSATSEVRQGTGNTDSLTPTPSTPDGSGDAQPDSPGGSDDVTGVPLPDQLKGLGSMLGISNVDELLDKAVSMGLLSQEQADRLRESIGSGQSLGNEQDQGGPSQVENEQGESGLEGAGHSWSDPGDSGGAV